MRTFIKILWVFILSVTLLPKGFAQYQPDSLQISLLTASPGNEVYEKFGHTAIRVKDRSGRVDLIFNYGLFSFNSPNFIYRFVKGETDYQLGITEMPYFTMEYAMRGSRVTEQVLNLTPAEASEVFHALQINYQPENRIYRYNFFYDNCSTRPRDIIEKNIDGSIGYIDPSDTTSYRALVHEMTGPRSWLTFGIDLTLGEKADRLIDYRQEMFLPEILMEAFETALVQNDSVSKPLVRETLVLVEENNEDSEIAPEKWYLSPIFVCWVLFFIIFALAITEIRRKKIYRILDTLIFIPAGLAGCVLFFLNFVSTHPTVDHNFNCFWLQPLDLLAGAFVWVKSAKKILYYYHFANFVTLLLLLICYAWIPQQFNPAFFPLIGVIMTRSAVHIILRQKNNRLT